MTYFEKFRKLKENVPHIGIRGFKNFNCEYNDYLYFSKNCYMCFTSDKFWDCFYCEDGAFLKDCCDCNLCEKSELCYESLDCRDCYDSAYLQDCRRVSQSMFCYDCIGCNNCFGCAGLRQKKYCLFNEQLDEETYKIKVGEWKGKGARVIFSEFENVKLKIPHQHTMFYRVENGTGDHLENVQNSVGCFDSISLQDCGYCYHAYISYGDRNRDNWDAFQGVDNEGSYEWIDVGKSYDCSFLYYCEVVRNCDYCFQVFNSKNCFLCCGVNHGENMILNKKFDNLEVWEKEKAKVIEQMKIDGEWGQWMVPEGEKMDC